MMILFFFVAISSVLYKEIVEKYMEIIGLKKYFSSNTNIKTPKDIIDMQTF